MRNEVVRLLPHGNAQRAQHWNSNASLRWRVRSAASSVVVLFPGRSRILRRRLGDAAARPETATMLAELEQENAELRRHVVDLALEIQELKAAPANRHKLGSMSGL
jgi:hypothetical protein